MNIYFSCSLTGGRADQPIYAALVEALLAEGHSVPTAALAQITLPIAAWDELDATVRGRLEAVWRPKEMD